MKHTRPSDSSFPPTVLSKIFRYNDVEPAERLVYLALLQYVSKSTGLCFPSKATLAKDTGYTKQTIDVHIASLIEKGHVVLHAKGGGRRSNTYLLPEVVDWIEESQKSKEKEPMPGTANADIDPNELNNNINVTDNVNNNVNNNLTESQPDATEKQPNSVANVTELLKKSVGYDQIHSDLADRPELVKLLDLTISVASQNADAPRDCNLNKKNIPAEKLRERMLSLTEEQIRYVIAAYAGLQKKPDAEHQQGYILSMLYFAEQTAKRVEIPDKQSSPESQNRFHNFHQREDYDYAELEKQLLKNQW